ncbi:MAG: hypothetical protein VB933_03105 [Pseudomonadales bacterium]
MSLDSVALLIEQIVITMMTTDVAEHAELASLFEKLQLLEPGQESRQVESRIWEVWCNHEEPEAAEAMELVIAAFNQGSLTDANEKLNQMVDRWPTWAEAWNKRATLRFIEERDLESMQDIERTLQLEPRHFGAISGFGQLCMRVGDVDSAVIAFERAVSLNPNFEDIRKAIEYLERELPRTLH